MRMKYPDTTTRPEGLDAWTDASWSNDGAASLALVIATEMLPERTLTLWVLPDSVTDFSLSGGGRYLLTISDSGQASDSVELMESDDLAAIKAKISEYTGAK